MSLDIYLHADAPVPRSRAPRIFIREDGQTKQISREEWDARYPGREPVTLPALDEEDPCVYHANITHNLTTMAEAAGLYTPLWRPEEIGVTRAAQLIPLLRDGLCLLLAEPQRFEAYNPRNGWGTYRQLCIFVRDYLAACEQYPGARVVVSR